jgi:hypothetical protein
LGGARFEYLPEHLLFWVSLWISQTLQENSGVVPLLRHGHFLPNPPPQILHLSIILPLEPVQSG